MDNLPIPDYLKNYYVVIKANDDVAVEGKIVCECGCDEFTLSYYGKRSFFNYLHTAKSEIGRKLVLNARCFRCSKNLTIYSSHENESSSSLDLDAFDCHKCHKNKWNLVVMFNSYGKKILISKGYEKWNNKYENIFIDVKCTCCEAKKLTILEK